MKRIIILLPFLILPLPAAPTNTAASASSSAATAAAKTADNASKAEEALANTKRTFLYGTPAQIRGTLDRIKKTKSDRELDIISEHYKGERKRPVKLAILAFFKEVIDARAKPILLAALADEDDAVSKEAYGMLVYYPEKDLEQFMIKGLTLRDTVSLEGCIKALGEIKSQNAATNLIALYTNEATKESTRSEIIAALGKIGVREAEEHIRNAARDAGESAFVRYQAIVALKAFPTRENWSVLQSILAEDVSELTARVIYVLPAYGAFTDVKRELIDAAKSDSERVRETAVKGLSQYKGEDTKKLLLFRLATEASTDVVLAVLDALAEYDDGDGPASESARTAIRDMYKNARVTKVKNRAKEILDKKGIVIDEKK
ncbi:MAG: hypothetical protein AABZ39_02250 [Spirochaetota bacterium]